MGPNGIHASQGTQRAGQCHRHLSIIFQWSWESGEVSDDHWPVNLTSVSGKIMEKIMLGVIEKHLKDSEVVGNSQYEFMRGRSCLTNSVSFYDKVTHLDP